VSPDRAVLHRTRPPPPALLKAEFPRREYPAGTDVFRSHGHGRSAWWFSSSGEGRFDLADPRGTCYVAEAEVTTLLETWAGMQVVPDYILEARDMSRLRLPGEVTVADLTSNRAVQYGVTAEIFTTVDYALAQLWASAFNKAGFDGIRYWARHDLAHTAACLALFGASGAPKKSTGFDAAFTDHLPDRTDLLGELEEETGITVLPVPPR
jgi:RES domain